MLTLEQQIFKQLEKAKNVLVIFPADWEGDAAAAALAWFLLLKKLNINSEVAGFKEEYTKSPLSFLPGFSEIKDELSNLRRFIVSLDISQTKVSQIKYAVDNDRLNFIVSPAAGWFKPEDVSSRAGEFKYDLIITCGARDLESLGKLYDQNIEFFYKTTIINIDNQSANEEFGQINFIDLNAVAVSEIIFYLFKNYKPELINEDIATCLLAGIIHKTRNFKSANLTPRTLLTTSQLISLGARREEIVDRLYRSRELSTLKLWGRMLNNLQAESGSQIIWSKLATKDFQETNATENDVADIVDELIANVPQAKLIAIFSIRESSKINLLIYSLKNLSALELIKEYQPRGTIKLAQAELSGGEELIPEIINKLKAALDKISDSVIK